MKLRGGPKAEEIDDRSITICWIDEFDETMRKPSSTHDLPGSLPVERSFGIVGLHNLCSAP